MPLGHPWAVSLQVNLWLNGNQTWEAFLKHHLNRRVLLNEDSKFKNLYPWSLQEIDDQRAQIGRDLIPWDWSLAFTATDVAYSEGMTIAPDFGSSDEEPSIVTRNWRHIRAKLRPGSPEEWHRYRQTSYSMLGTDRTISDFMLFIEPLADGEEQDRCRVWGSVRYTADYDFSDETKDDTVVFYLYVQPEAFERYVKTVRAAQVDTALLQVRRVEGFYSAWSPDITTNSIKVLTNYEKDHPVEVREGSEIVPPRLGDVGEVSLTFIRKLTLEHPAPEPVDDDWQDIDEFAQTPPDKALVLAKHSANANARAVALLTSLRTAAWAIAALLLLILIT